MRHEDAYYGQDCSGDKTDHEELTIGIVHSPSPSCNKRDLPKTTLTRSFTPDMIFFVPERKGKFVTIEGLDGCGKSTQLEKLAAALRADGVDLVVTREPGGTATGERIRSVLLDSATAGLSPWAEMALMFASRAQHLQEIVLPALEGGRLVLCDRFTDSTEAYQGGGRKLGSEPVLALHRILCADIQPDLTILMDSEVSASVARARRRNRSRTAGGSAESDENRFEQENRAFFERVRDKYLEIARREAQRFFVVDARRSSDVVHPEILRTVRERLNLLAKTGAGTGAGAGGKTGARTAR